MAEFKLGRIRFVWKENWLSSTTYYKDDIVRNGGNTYVCVTGHTSSVFATDFDSYWNKLSDGQEWKGEWTTSAFYKINDVVKYGGNLYIANAAHTSASSAASGLEIDVAKWDQYAEGFDYQAAWSIDYRYKVNDIVKYNSTVYICTQAHESAATIAEGLEVDQAKWDTFATGITWQNIWTIGERYVVNDVVKYGGHIYVCNQGHTSAATFELGLENDQSKWDVFHAGIEYLADWQNDTRYRVNDVVKYGGGLWICITFHSSTSSFIADQGNWVQFVEGLEFEDSWERTKVYQSGDLVTYGGYNYVAVTTHQDSVPTVGTDDWDLFNSGFKFAGEYGADSSLQDYRTGDVVTVGGYTYLCIADSNGNRPPNATYWERLNSGIYWKDAWTDATLYDLGDAVRYGNNSYICVSSHTSDETVAQNRPDQDVDGSEWNLLSGGAELTVLTTLGDLAYYGGSGATRLPIGEVGQVLTVNSSANAPEWKYLGAVNNVYYVETQGGVDGPAPTYGTTLDQPFKTIRYATEQVEKGPLRPNARYLLEINRSFVQDESVEWMNTQITNDTTAANGSIWDGFVVDDAAKCRRDLGQIIDALTQDLGRNGNVQTRKAALTYFENGTLIASITDEDQQLVAVIDYMETVIDAVISSVDPAATYGSLTQIKDAATYPEESDAQTTVVSLLDIITDAVTAGVSSGIPAEYKPQNTIFVKTGTFEEVLPIIIPENTAVVGDELRSTRIEPAGSLVDPTDTPYTLAALERMAAITSAVITHGSVTKTTGNALDPVTTSPAGSAAAGTFASDLWTQIRDYADYAVNGVTGDSTVPVSYGSNTPNTTTDYTYAVETLEANRAFLKAETTAYVQDTYTDTATNTTTSTNVITVSDTSWMNVGTALRFSGTTFGGISTGTTYYVKTVENSTTFTVSLTRGGTAVALSTATGTMTVDLYYDSAKCERDVSRYIDAIKHDLIYTGNYKSLLYARYYGNAVKGSKLEDMFYLRNGTGLRNCTVAGLDGRTDGKTQIVNIDPEVATVGYEYTISALGDTNWNTVAGTVGVTYSQGDAIVVDTASAAGTTGTLDSTGLLESNAYGTQRPLAGAFTSLDPGWGPAHTAAWITNKSPYIQNVSTFGTACIGCKIDGDLHDSGNDSIVSNDFTQIISDGIGVWCTNLGRTELVSVFSYYAHIGYLAENGGKIRATNGNSSYGNFGTVAEGIDNTEAPITATVTNQNFDAVIERVLTDGNNILTVEYLNAGVNYTVAGTTINLAGEGFGAVINSPVTNDGAVFEIRLLDTDVNTDGTSDIGGDGYITATNAAQTGNATSIKIANTDTRLSSQYIGMAIWIVAGTGAGQYAIVDTYNSGTKEMTVVKASDGSAGWDHVVSGTAIETTLDSSTTYNIEPAVALHDPAGVAPGDGGYSYSTSAKARAVVTDAQISAVLIWDTGVGYSSAPTITITDPNNTVDIPLQVRIGDGVLTQPTWTNRGTSYVTAEAAAEGDGYADLYQPGQFLQVENLSAEPQEGSNIVISGDSTVYKLVTVRSFAGAGPYTAQLQISPDLTVALAPETGTSLEMRIRYSQVRLTGHDFLDVGTGNFQESNYPSTPSFEPDSTKETVDNNGGRVFYTSTDQDGNFRVGELFSVEQSTGVATLNADAFNISGLQELSLGELGLGSSGAVITEFSTDGTFTADSDSIVPTQKAIKTYITSQIGGGAATLNVNSITAGVVQISSDTITTTTGAPININSTVAFNGGVKGSPIAINYYIGS